ncbi:DUF5627 domain-containing protein [Sphingobacterium bovistauri]|uniref:DUF1735 domain-containing protein n=1 Tax=Sphingobacterium bovistauri TaxID=2781959 RepID=A0ABS7Z348_9SPHI|nr:DUF5627 domain-containing protein [Sphingobacterium bovistauri]MCA5004613.1 DUF1735 domain-containing protein [Sphingobacterium bovistauri]
MKRKHIFSAILLIALSSCKNQEWEFPDYEYQTVYFAYQYPIRTITMGEDIFDTSLDNQGKINVMATTGGVYSSKEEVKVDFVVDNAMTQNMVYSSGGTDIVPLPANYYTLASNQMIIPMGKPAGGVEVQFTDAFFADPKSISTTYVLPLRITSVTNADSVLSGVPKIGSLQRRAVADDWDVQPKDYTFYAVKYVNTWHGNYLRRGQDVIVGKNNNTSLNKTQNRRNAYVEKDEVKNIITASRQNAKLPLTFKDVDGTNINIELVLAFDNNNNCTISSGSSGVTATGRGTFVKKGEKNSWGNTDRDGLYLEYQIEMSQMSVSTKDTLVMRDRGVKMETFTVALKP